MKSRGIKEKHWEKRQCFFFYKCYSVLVFISLGDSELKTCFFSRFRYGVRKDTMKDRRGERYLEVHLEKKWVRMLDN